MKHKIILCYLLALASLQPAFSQQGKPDSTFGNNGLVAINAGVKTACATIATQVLTSPNGDIFTVFFVNKIVHIIKKYADGTTDLNYGISGYSTPVNMINPTAAMQADGKIVIAGTTPKIPEEFEDFIHSDFIIVRFNTNGLPDHTFSVDGIETTDFNGLDDFATSITIQQDGKIVVGGIATSYINDGGTDNVYNMVIARYNNNGTLDNMLNGNGIAWAPDNYITITDWPTLVTLQPGGKIIATRSTDEYGLLMLRFNSNGSVDNTFALNTSLQTPDSIFVAKAITVQADGKIIVGGYWNWVISQDFALFRFSTNGSLDHAFGSQGHVSTDFKGYNDYVNALALQADGKIVATGAANNGSNDAFAIARYNVNGSADNTFDSDGKKMTLIGSSNVYPLALDIQNDEKIIVAGYNQPSAGNNMVLARYNLDGSFDNTFHGNGTIIENFKQGVTVYTSSAQQTDGKTVAAGYVFNGVDYDFLISRFTDGGRPDNTFSGDGNQTISFSASGDYAFAVAIQQDGKIIVAGKTFTNGNADFAIARINSDGSPDNTFDVDGRQTADISPDDNVLHLAIQKDGKILTGGMTTLIRYNTNGTLDVTFNGTGKLNTIIAVNDFALQSSGKIIVTGSYGNNFALARYNTNGTADHTFSQDGLLTSDLYPGIEYDGFTQYFSNAESIAIQKDDKIIIAGEAGRHERYSTETNIGIARYDRDGNPDHSFSEDGIRFLDYNVFGTYNTLFSKHPVIALQADNKIILRSMLYENHEEFNSPDVEDITAGFGICRLTEQGISDDAFGKDGYLEMSRENLFEINISANKLYVCGSTNDAGKTGIIARYLLGANNTPPVVVITSPANNTVFASPANLTINATASDANGSVHSVKFYNGDIYLKADFSAPYSYTISNLSSGTYTLKVKATDNLGVETYSLPVTVKVNTPPVVNISSPANNTMYTAPANVVINATATDADGFVQSVKFYNGSTYLKTDFSAPYSYTIANLPAGTYSIKVKATDNLGSETFSLVKTIMVRATPLRSSVQTLGKNSNDDYTTGITLSPNPARNIINISTSDFKNDKVLTISVFAPSGILVKQLKTKNSNRPISIDVSSMQSGTYTLQLKSGNKVIAKQFVKL